jgi:hypothetical protein
VSVPSHPTRPPSVHRTPAPALPNNALVPDGDGDRSHRLRASGHRIFRLPVPVRRGQPTLERNESRDSLAVVLAVPAHMQDHKEIIMLLQAWCSTNDDVNGYVLVLEDDGGWADFTEIRAGDLFGEVPEQALDSSMDFGLCPGRLHIVATSVYALQQQRRDFESIALDGCRLVAEQEATFAPARELLETCHEQALQIACQQLSDVADMQVLLSEEAEARCSLAFRYAQQVSKLFLNFRQVSELDRAAGAAMEHYHRLQERQRSEDPNGLQ